ncbi:MAG: dihydrolipoyl dehydrogenase [Salinirussus sp.]
MVVGDISTATDVLVVGAGPGGYVAAIRAAQHDMDVTLVERDAYGGTCLNHGCIPSKALITGAEIADRPRRAGEMGISADVDVDFGQMIDWKDGVVRQLTGGVKTLCEEHGVSLVEGTAVFDDATSARVVHEGEGEGSESVDFEHAIVATGSRPVSIPGFPFDDPGVLDSKAALALDTVPDRLVVVGAGYIGMELSTAFAKLGADVTVLEALETALPAYEDDVARVVRERAEGLGVDFRFGHAAAGYETADDGSGGIVVRADADDGTATVPADEVLVAVGREPVTDTVDPEAAGLDPDEDGTIRTDDQCRTGVDGIYAVGDVTGEPMLAHRAMYDGRVAAGAIAGEPVGQDARAVPAVVFTDPEIATVGMTADEAAAAGFDPAVGRMPLRANGRALTLDDADGFVRIVADADREHVLGAQLVGPEASELVAELALAIELGATLTDLAGTIHTHPTVSEAVVDAAESIHGRAIHTR